MLLGASGSICKWINLNFSEKLFLKKRKILMSFGKETKRKMAIRMHFSQAQIDVSPKIALQLEIFFWSPFPLVLLRDFFKKYLELTVYQLWNMVRIIRKM